MSALFKKVTVAFAAIMLLSACSSNGKKADNGHVMEFENTIGDRVFFGFDSAALSKESQETLMRQAEWLKNHKSFRVTIEGHCDERGTAEYNIALGEKRAHSVKQFLVSQGMDADSVEMISYGKEKPAVVGNDEEVYRQNRRGVTVLK